jgi:hypothetical protein
MAIYLWGGGGGQIRGREKGFKAVLGNTQKIGDGLFQGKRSFTLLAPVGKGKDG